VLTVSIPVSFCITQRDYEHKIITNCSFEARYATAYSANYIGTITLGFSFNKQGTFSLLSTFINHTGTVYIRIITGAEVEGLGLVCD
jgi:hypothetical protein